MVLFGTYSAPLLALATTIVLAQNSVVTVAPNTVEVDLLFPLNTTYAPNNFIPIVFALQNSRAAEPLSLLVTWRIFSNEYPFHDVLSGRRDLTWTDFHNGQDAQDPYYVLFYAHNALNLEGEFRLLWDVSVLNCTLDHDVYYNRDSGLSRATSGMSVDFTLRNGTQLPTLAASVNVCPIEVLTVGITHTVKDKGSSISNGRDTCAALSVSPPKANPCAATLDGPMAANITANVTRLACRNRALTTGCPPLTCKEMALTMEGCPESNAVALSVSTLGVELVGWTWMGALASCVLGMAMVVLQ